jgi:hypothetical protein
MADDAVIQALMMNGPRTVSPSYNTQLNPLDEMAYRQWVQQNNIPTNPNATQPQDYDMRGFYQGLQQQNPIAQTAVNPNDNQLHFPDYWKTPIHQSFSNESQWATPGTPSWINDSQLASPGGRIVYDEKQQTSPLIKALMGGQ